MLNPDIPLTAQQKKDKHAEEQRNYMTRLKMGWMAQGSEPLTSQIAQLNGQLTELRTGMTILQNQLNEKNVQIGLLQQSINIHESYRSQYQLDENFNVVANLNNQLQEKDNIISQLRSQISNNQPPQNDNVELNRRIEELTLRNTELSELRNSIPQIENRYQQQLSTKDTDISNLNAQINTLQSDCVRVDLNRRLEELTRTVADKARQEQLCLQTISQLNADNSNLNIFRDFFSDINSRYPKILLSYINELQRPGNQSQYPELNAWAQSELSNITPNNVSSLEPFKRGGESPIMNQNIQPVSKVINQNVQYVPQVVNQNVQSFPQVMNQNVQYIPPVINQHTKMLFISPNNKHPMVKDPLFHQWIPLYNDRVDRNGSEYNKLNYLLKKKYNVTPLNVLKM